ncbi:hypothetical protein [Streptomyces venetus]|uniref:hypothetical protein n=1 Tax=Streptomyces venetus TaxID=1701086 RepID=UPI003C2DF161
MPGDGTLPELPRHIGVLTPGATTAQRLAGPWLIRCPAAHRITLTPRSPLSQRLSTAAIGIIDLIAVLLALSHGVPADLALPALLLASLLTEHWPTGLTTGLAKTSAA